MYHQRDKKTQELLASGNDILIDIREADEHAREHIRGAQSLPLSTFKSECLDGYSNNNIKVQVNPLAAPRAVINRPISKK